jgi:predicted alpha/beta hydrolase family esterase
VTPARDATEYFDFLILSVNDPYVTLPRAKEFAENWGTDICAVGELGHINADSRLGFWPQGLLMLGQLLARGNC